MQQQGVSALWRSSALDGSGGKGAMFKDTGDSAGSSFGETPLARSPWSSYSSLTSWTSDSSGISSLEYSFSDSSTGSDQYYVTQVLYQGRDLLDLGANLRADLLGWSFMPATLPTHDVEMFFMNRSQYHRLGPHGRLVEFNLAQCCKCDFVFAAAAQNS